MSLQAWGKRGRTTPDAVHIARNQHMQADKRLELSFEIGHSLHRAGQMTDDLFSAAAGGIDITARQLTVLEIIGQSHGPSQMDICSLTGIDRSTIADMVLRLINKGYVERQRSCSDARRYMLQLTAAGRQVLETAQPIARRVQSEILASVPQDCIAPLRWALEGIVNASDPLERL